MTLRSKLLAHAAVQFLLVLAAWTASWWVPELGPVVIVSLLVGIGLLVVALVSRIRAESVALLTPDDVRLCFLCGHPRSEHQSTTGCGVMDRDGFGCWCTQEVSSCGR